MTKTMCGWALVGLMVAGLCSGGCTASTGSGGEIAKVHLDGSSTVFPISEAIAEEFRAAHPEIRVTVGVSGTGGGFKRFCIGEIDINDASRPIKDKEIQKASDGNVEFIELPVAFDGISVVVNPKNSFVNNLTVAELTKIWGPTSKVATWNDVRPEWPSDPIKLYGPGHDSGTFDYFTEAVNGKSAACRADFTASEDDNVLVRGVSGDHNSLGFFGFAYYKENAGKVRAVPITTPAGDVSPTVTTINDGTYTPLSRPLFIYVSKKAAERPEVQKFVLFYLDKVKDIATEVGYVPLPDRAYELARERFEKRTTGTIFQKAEAGVDIVEFMSGVASH